MINVRTFRRNNPITDPKFDSFRKNISIMNQYID